MFSYGGDIILSVLPLLLILFGILIVALFFAFVIWMLVDCIRREEKDFKDRTLWIVLLTVGIFLGYSLIISVVYYFAVKRELDNK